MDKMDNLGQRIDWLDVISTDDARRDCLKPRLYAAENGERTCYGVRLNERWLSGRNATVRFDSTEAAQKFLYMIGIEGLPTEAGMPALDEALSANCHSTYQCFHLSESGGLGNCPNKRNPQWQAIHGLKDARSTPAHRIAQAA